VDFGGGDPTHTPKQVGNLRGFCFELEGIVHVLIRATSALAKNGAFWNKASRRRLQDSDQIRFGMVFLRFHHLHEDAFAGQCSVNKADPPVWQSAHTRATVGDTFN